MKRLTLRKKSGEFWCTIYASKLGPTIWTIGLVINKSKRASNDWYTRRKNKRSHKVKNETKQKTLKQLRVCLKLLKILFSVLPQNADVIIYNDFKEAEALSKYTERLGFIPIYRFGYPVWVLTAPKKREALRRF